MREREREKEKERQRGGYAVNIFAESADIDIPLGY